MAHGSVGPAESWLRKIHRVCVYLPVWLRTDTTLDVWPDADSGSPRGEVRATHCLLRVSTLCAFFQGTCTVS